MTDILDRLREFVSKSNYRDAWVPITKAEAEDVLVTIDHLTTALATAQAERDAAIAERDAAIAELDALRLAIIEATGTDVDLVKDHWTAEDVAGVVRRLVAQRRDMSENTEALIADLTAARERVASVEAERDALTDLLDPCPSCDVRNAGCDDCDGRGWVRRETGGDE